MQKKHSSTEIAALNADPNSIAAQWNYLKRLVHVYTLNTRFHNSGSKSEIFT